MYVQEKELVRSISLLNKQQACVCLESLHFVYTAEKEKAIEDIKFGHHRGRIPSVGAGHLQI